MDYTPEKICSITYHLELTPISSSLALANQNGVPRFEPAFREPLLLAVISDSFEELIHEIYLQWEHCGNSIVFAVN